IANVAGRGYCFVGQITPGDAPCVGAKSSYRADDCASDLPRRSMRMIGRDHDARFITELLEAHRFVTVHGPGGIGKTTVAIAVADSLGDAFADGIRFLDLGLRTPRAAVPDVLAAALGLIVQTDDSMHGIVNYLRSRQMLLIFDCCEHVIDSAASLAEAIF